MSSTRLGENLCHGRLVDPGGGELIVHRNEHATHPRNLQISHVYDRSDLALEQFDLNA